MVGRWTSAPLRSSNALVATVVPGQISEAKQQTIFSRGERMQGVRFERKQSQETRWSGLPILMEEMAEVLTGEPRGKGIPVSRSRMRRMPGDSEGHHVSDIVDGKTLMVYV